MYLIRRFFTKLCFLRGMDLVPSDYSENGFTKSQIDKYEIAFDKSKFYLPTYSEMLRFFFDKCQGFRQIMIFIGILAISVSLVNYLINNNIYCIVTAVWASIAVMDEIDLMRLGK